MEFKKRTEAPSASNKYYISTSNGGYNKCIIIKNGSCIPNCVGYAYGRFMEEQGITKCNLPTCNAESWINRNTSYKTGSTAKLGAVIVWGKGKVGNGSDGAGHVGVVEEIYSDGSFLTSNSAYGSTRFYTKKINKNCKLSGYTFLGFIYPDATFETEWTAGKYKLLYNKAIRNTHYLGNNILKVSQIGLLNRSKLTSNNKNDNAYYKAGTIINVKSIYRDSTSRVWGQLNGAWIVLCNKDGSEQAVKV